MTFTPTATAEGQPTTCRCCGRHAIGMGISRMAKSTDDPGYLCGECILLIEEIKRVRRMDPYELAALDGGVDAVGEYIDSIGGLTELAEFDELQQRMLVKAAWQGCADRLRELIRKGDLPF
ncbi:DUF6511 domain-containing protein [Rhizobium sp. CBN3]|uniref:DUF6511 domain-containing protein n=1 Tax=Rhizobium sp. CBN3 TaxID=3058045 RepID=UPI002673657E|nr:DUF6511 domain-containing protein [Rhizobium sp. CBN3]MDO3431168.1 DUF6511 domain-containing protein [Rhizobium sp. CBN3]